MDRLHHISACHALIDGIPPGERGLLELVFVWEWKLLADCRRTTDGRWQVLSLQSLSARPLLAASRGRPVWESFGVPAQQHPISAVSLGRCRVQQMQASGLVANRLAPAHTSKGHFGAARHGLLLLL